jgi:hypothetical protein
MRRYLVVANQTLAGEELHREIHRRIEEGDSEFTVLVPVTRARDYAAPVAASGSGAAFAFPTGDQDRPSSDEVAWNMARDRMKYLVGEIRDEGGAATGKLGDADPLAAIKDELGNDEYDEIILSKLPPGISRWWAWISPPGWNAISPDPSPPSSPAGEYAACCPTE